MLSFLAALTVASSYREVPLPLHVSGLHVVDSGNRPVKLRGINICSLEWTAQGDHVLESVDQALGSWNANIIRLPLSQDRWFGKTQDSPDGGAPYQALVHQVVDKIRSHGAYVILDLHWSDGDHWGQDIGQHTLPDAHSVEFWKSCAAAFANDPSVIFDLYNEPIKASWAVWRDGGDVTEEFQGKHLQYHAAGLQTLLDAIRSTGAMNMVHCGGLGYSSQLDFPESALLSDPKGNGVVYVSHFYPGWERVPSWQTRVEQAAKRLPIFVEEFGDDQVSAPMDTPAHRIGQILAVLKKNDFNWTAWCMHTGARPCLITDWNYHPTPEFGSLIKAALAGQTVAIPPRRMSAPDFHAYDGKLEEPWQNWSNAKVDLKSSEPGHGSANSLKADIGPNQQLQLGTVPFDGLAYKAVSFWAKAAPGTSAKLQLTAQIMDKAQSMVPLKTVGDEWTKITVPFDELGVSGMEDIKSLLIRNQDASSSSEIFLDDLQVLGK